MAAPPADYDSPWKEVLRAYFQQAVEFFFPEAATQLNWQQPWEFLDKEFQQITLEAETGKRYADQLVRVHRQQGEPVWLLLHIEIQASRERDFAKRMFVYHCRIFERFGQHPLSLAILCDKNRNWRPTEYAFVDQATELRFRFSSVKLVDYWQHWAALEQSDNLFAVVVMAHLQAQRTRPDSLQRQQEKFRLIRSLYERGLASQDIRNLFRFVDWVMILQERRAAEFWHELQTYERERNMPYITSVQKIGEKIGEKIGFEKGERALVLRQLARRVGNVTPELQTQVEALDLQKLEALGEALLDFNALSDLQAWLNVNSN